MHHPPCLYTIGFAGKGAERFFTLLAEHQVQRVLDIRRNNRSQLAGFARRDDLRYLLRALIGVDYLELDALAPPADLLTDWRRKLIDWPAYEARFVAHLADTASIDDYPLSLLEGACLLCSEPTPGHCHRRLVGEWLARNHHLQLIHLC